MREKVIFLVGPTGVGKTQVSIELAKRVNCEIICCDSMQVYKGMDIISCKVSKSIRKKIPHHLTDIVSVEEEFNVAEWVNLALKSIREIHKKRKIPLVVGGSMLYMSCLLDGIFALPSYVKTDAESIRDSLYKEAEEFGKEFLYRRLERTDPLTAEKIHPNDLRRIIRALEVYEIHQIPISILQKGRRGIISLYDTRTYGLIRQREELYKRIDERIERIFRDGLVREIKNLVRLNLSKTASQVIGIKEIKGYLEKKYTLEETKHLISKKTRNYARRQMSWFRRDKRIKWIEIQDSDDEKSIAEKILNLDNL